MDVQQGPRPVSSVGGERVARSDGALAAGDHRDCGRRPAPVPAAGPRCQPGESPRGQRAAGHVFGGAGDGEFTAGNGVVDSQLVSGWGLDSQRLAGHHGRRRAEWVPGGGGGGQDGWEVPDWVRGRTLFQCGEDGAKQEADSPRRRGDAETLRQAQSAVQRTGPVTEWDGKPESKHTPTNGGMAAWKADRKSV